MKIKMDNFRLPGLLQSALFISTILISAFLLFWAQPLFAKMILPILGGSSSVWTSSMLFFQFTLLAGYAYAHFSGKLLAVKSQILLHLLLLGLACVSLPFYIDHARYESPEGSPVFWVLSIAAFTVGAPFFMVSATAPMLQRWFSLTGHKNRGNPYFLYAASNLGSMAALLCFPTLLEPSLGVQLQTRCWQAGYFVLQVLFVAVGLVTLRNQAAEEGLSVLPSALSIPYDLKISVNRRITWVFLAFVPSSMMLGLTSHVTTDIAPVAMFWIIPLALYLFSFVIAFSRSQHLIPNKGLAAITLLCASAMLYMRFEGYDKTINTAGIAVILNLVLFFSSAWLFHGYLSSSRPSPAHLTEFYLWLSIGGMLGGIFNALLAPIIFNQIYEYYFVVVAVFFISLKVLVEKTGQPAVFKTPQAFTMIFFFAVLLFVFLLIDIIMSRPVTVKVRQSIMLASLAAIVCAVVGAYYKRGILSRSVVAITVVVGVLVNVFVQTQTHSNILLARSFYGALKVKQKLDADDVPYHLFIHGGTRHNLQKFDADVEENQEPLMYFHRQANIGHAVSSMKAHLDRMLHLGFVGLGAGAMSAYVDVGDTATFYEIDLEVAAMAQNREYFTYCSEAKGNVEIVIGDARLQLRKAADSSFDILLIDAFSSDAIPVHLLTAEAVALYLRKIKEDGLLLFHLSNRYLDLHRVLQGLGLPSGYVLYYASKNNVERPVLPANGISGIFSHSQVALIARQTSLPVAITESDRWQKLEHDSGLKAWTDDFSNIFAVFRLVRGE